MPTPIRLLLVEDDADIAEVVRAYLERDGYAVAHFRDGAQALAGFHSGFDLAVLDIMLPGLDGYGLLRELRQHSQIPVLLLSGRDDPMDKVLGLELGADDYLVKPFFPQELSARVRGLLRRCVGTAPVAYRDLNLDPGERRAYVGERLLDLTRTEFDLLLFFVQHPGQVLTRAQIMARLWDGAVLDNSRSVDAHLRNLRLKLRQADSPADRIRAVRGVGYRLD